MIIIYILPFDEGDQRGGGLVATAQHPTGTRAVARVVYGPFRTILEALDLLPSE